MLVVFAGGLKNNGGVSYLVKWDIELYSQLLLRQTGKFQNTNSLLNIYIQEFIIYQMNF